MSLFQTSLVRHGPAAGSAEDELARGSLDAGKAFRAKRVMRLGSAENDHLVDLFGVRVPVPFHVYSMRQAIEEGFILDVLKNYTPYKLAFRLAHDGRDWDDTEVEKSAANKAIMKWVQLHPWNISQKVQIVVEHYRENVQPLLDGKGKAMVVLGSRVEAVRWQLAIQKYIAEKGYTLGTLVPLFAPSIAAASAPRQPPLTRSMPPSALSAPPAIRPVPRWWSSPQAPGSMSPADATPPRHSL